MNARNDRDIAADIYNAAKPRREQLGKGWRKVVVLTIMEELKITEAAAAAQYNALKKREDKEKMAQIEG